MYCSPIARAANVSAHTSVAVLFCGPSGDILGEAGDAPAVLTAGIDLDVPSEVRGRMPFLRDLRPELYGPLAEER